MQTISKPTPNKSWTGEEEIHFSFKQKNGNAPPEKQEKSSFQFEINADAHPNFFELAKKNDTISLVVLFSAFSVLIKKYTIQKNIVINTPHLATVENGPLLLPISLYTDTQRSFKEHLKMCQQTLKEEYSKQKADILN